MVVVQGIRLIPTLSAISILPYAGEIMWHSCSIPIITSHIPIVKSTNIYWIYQIAKLSLIVFIHIISLYLYIYMYWNRPSYPPVNSPLTPKTPNVSVGNEAFQPLSASGSSRQGPGIERSKARGCTQRGSKLVGKPRNPRGTAWILWFLSIYIGTGNIIYNDI